MPTKEQERKALEQIKKILASLGNSPETSYVCAAFVGCIDDAESNIENDFADSWYQRYLSQLERTNKEANKYKDIAQEYAQATKEVQAQKERAERAENLYNTTQRTSDNWCAKYHDAAQEAQEYKEKAVALEAEIMKLKAKLYDLIVKED